MLDKYVLIGQTPVLFEGTMGEWSEWMFRDDSNRRVALTEVPFGSVSTVFLGLDHGWGQRTPILFETMAFWDGGGDDQDRSGTWDEAMAIHKEMCDSAMDPAMFWLHLCGAVVTTVKEMWEELGGINGSV